MNLMGLGGVLTFNAGNSLGVMGSVRQAMSGMTQAASGLGTTLRGLSLALVPVVAGLGVAYNASLQFEHQMAGVAAVAGATPTQLSTLAAHAKMLGATTSYTATQVAEGMELMARAGFRTTEIVKGVGGVVAAAAADAMPMARAAEVIGTTIRGMGLAAKDMTRVADVMALASASSNTNINNLGYGFSYAQATARQLGLTLEQTAATMGKLADAGMEGSMMGTSLTQMLLHLAKPSKDARALLAQMGISQKMLGDAFKVTREEAAAGVSPISKLIDMISPRMQKYSGVLDKAAVQSTLFGIRGIKAYAALEASGTKSLMKFTHELQNAEGAAARMADTRLDSVIGQLVLLKSAVEGVAIEFFTPFQRSAAAGVRFIRQAVGDMAMAMQLLRDGDLIGGAFSPDEEMNRKWLAWGKIGLTIKNFAMGVNTAVDNVVAAYARLRAFSSSVLASLVGESDAAQQQFFGRMLTYAALAAPALLAVTTTLLGMGAAFAIMLPLVKGVFALFAGVGAVALLKPLLLLGAAFLLLRHEGESVGETFTRVWAAVSSRAMDLWSNGLLPILTGIRDGLAPAMGPLWRAWESVFGSIRYLVGSVFDYFSAGTTRTRTDWYTVARTIAEVIGKVVVGFVQVYAKVMWLVARVTAAFVRIGLILSDTLLTPFRLFINLIGDVGRAVADLFAGNFTSALTRFSKAIIDAMLLPMREVVKAMVRVNDFVGKESPQAMRDFAFGTASDPVLPTVAPAPEPNQSLPEDVSGAMSIYGAAKALPPVLSASVVYEDKSQIEVKVQTDVDGRTLSMAQARHQTEINERSGFKATPWQRRSAVDFGSPATR